MHPNLHSQRLHQSLRLVTSNNRKSSSEKIKSVCTMSVHCIVPLQHRRSIMPPEEKLTKPCPVTNDAPQKMLQAAMECCVSGIRNVKHKSMRRRAKRRE